MNSENVMAGAIMGESDLEEMEGLLLDMEHNRRKVQETLSGKFEALEQRIQFLEELTFFSGQAQIPDGPCKEPHYSGWDNVKRYIFNTPLQAAVYRCKEAVKDIKEVLLRYESSLGEQHHTQLSRVSVVKLLHGEGVNTESDGAEQYLFNTPLLSGPGRTRPPVFKRSNFSSVSLALAPGSDLEFALHFNCCMSRREHVFESDAEEQYHLDSIPCYVSMQDDPERVVEPLQRWHWSDSHQGSEIYVVKLKEANSLRSFFRCHMVCCNLKGQDIDFARPGSTFRHQKHWVRKQRRERKELRRAIMKSTSPSMFIKEGKYSPELKYTLHPIQ